MGGCFHVYIIVSSSLYNILFHIYIISRSFSSQARLWLISQFTFVLFASFVVRTILCFSLSLCHSVSKRSFVSICHYVILSSKKTFVSICHYVILSQKIICLRPSLCYSVLKHSSVFVRLPVILSLIYSVCLMLKCLYKEAYKGPEKRRGICIRNEYVTVMYSVGYRQQRRRRLISIKKGVFNMQEGHILEARRVSS